jgi:hypothetical protein
LEAGTVYFYCARCKNGRREWRFHGGEDPDIHNQVGFQSSPAVVDGVVYTGCRDSNVYALDAATGREIWRFNNGGSWVISSPAVVQGKEIFGTSDSSLYHVLDAATGKSLIERKTKAFMFSSPAVAGNIVYIGVLNGTLEARDLMSGALVWEFQTETSRRNKGWVLTGERRFNTALLYAFELARRTDRRRRSTIRDRRVLFFSARRRRRRIRRRDRRKRSTRSNSRRWKTASTTRSGRVSRRGMRILPKETRSPVAIDVTSRRSRDTAKLTGEHRRAGFARRSRRGDRPRRQRGAGTSRELGDALCDESHADGAHRARGARRRRCRCDAARSG